MKKIKAKDINAFVTIRIKKGYTASDFAKAAGISRQALYDFESGKYGFKPKNANAILKLLGCEFEEIFTVE